MRGGRIAWSAVELVPGILAGSELVDRGFDGVLDVFGGDRKTALDHEEDQNGEADDSCGEDDPVDGDGAAFVFLERFVQFEQHGDLYPLNYTDRTSRGFWRCG